MFGLSRSEWFGVAVTLILVLITDLIGGHRAALLCGAVGFVILVILRLTRKPPKASDEGEDKKHPRSPLIKGRIFHVRFNGIVSSATGLGHHHRQISSAVLFGVYLCNHEEPETNLQDIVLDGKNLTPPVAFGKTVGEIKNKPLKFGCGITLPSLQVAATIVGYGHRSELPQIDLQALKAYAVDGLGNQHELSVDSGESLLFSP